MLLTCCYSWYASLSDAILTGSNILFSLSSSHEENYPTFPTRNKHELPVPKSSLSMRTDTNALEGQVQLNSKRDEAPTCLEKVDIVQLSPEYFGEQKAPDHSERAARRFSDSSSDSESDSGSRHKSRSRSPVDQCASRSTDDSESDTPSHSEETSDDDLDIMTQDDDRWVKYKLHASENGLSKSPIPLTSQDTEPSKFRIGEKQHACVTDVFEIEKDLPDTERINVTESGPIEEREIQMRKLYGETIKMMNNQSDCFGRAPKSKHESVLDGKRNDKPDVTKRQKAGNMNQQNIIGSINPLFAKNSNKVGVSSKNQDNVTERSLEAYGDNHGKVSTGEAEQHDTEEGVCPPVTKECKMLETNLGTDLNDRQEDTSLMRSYDGCQEGRQSSPDEISSSFSKYEKEEPEFRVPIKGFSQYVFSNPGSYF